MNMKNFNSKGTLILFNFGPRSLISALFITLENILESAKRLTNWFSMNFVAFNHWKSLQRTVDFSKSTAVELLLLPVISDAGCNTCVYILWRTDGGRFGCMWKRTGNGVLNFQVRCSFLYIFFFGSEIFQVRREDNEMVGIVIVPFPVRVKQWGYLEWNFNDFFIGRNQRSWICLWMILVKVGEWMENNGSDSLILKIFSKLINKFWNLLTFIFTIQIEIWKYWIKLERKIPII